MDAATHILIARLWREIASLNSRARDPQREIDANSHAHWHEREAENLIATGDQSHLDNVPTA